jgi:ribonuclease BN (tRNA processing enzyme)
VQIKIIGCSGSFPGPDSAASSYLVEADGFRLLMDLGAGALGALQRYADLYAIDAVCLSHLHGDHCLDLCMYSVARLFHPDGPKPRIPVYGPSQTEARLSQALAAETAQAAAGGASQDQGHGMTDAFSFTAITPGTMEIGPLRITSARMSHPVETYGFRIEHAGRALAYSADTGPSDALVNLARDADVLLCEASFLEPADGGAAGLPPGLHLTGRQAGEHAERAGAGELVLTHLVPWNDQDRTLDEAGGAFSGESYLARPGLSVVFD